MTARERQRSHAPSWWRGLSTWSRISVLGLVAAGSLAAGLGVFIPRQVEVHMLEAQTTANQAVLTSLLRTRTLDVEDGLRNVTDLNAFVQASILRGDYVRVKLWSPEGTILYSDEPSLIGLSFEPEAPLFAALEGRASSRISDLSATENRLERDLAGRLLEFYVPVEEGDDVVAVWEVYQSLDPFERQLDLVRRSVWMSVGLGLSVLLVFLVSTFGSLARSIQRRRDEAEERSHALAALYEVSRSVSGAPDPDERAAAAVRALRRARGYVELVLLRADPTGDPVVAAIAAAGKPSQRPAAADLVHGAPGWGVVEIGDPPASWLAVRGGPANPLPPAERALLETAGEQIRAGVQNATLFRDLAAAESKRRRLTDRVVSAHEEERKRLAGEIHDGLGQDLHRVLFGLRGCHEAPPSEVAEELRRLESLLEGSSRRLRGLIQGLRPPTLEDVGLAASLRILCDRVAEEDGLRIRLVIPSLTEPPVPARVAAYRIIQEALRNIAKHAGTRDAFVELGEDRSVLVVKVEDRGHGMSAAASEGVGLWLMRERAETLGGDLAVRSGPDGTTVTARIPLEPVS